MSVPDPLPGGRTDPPEAENPTTRIVDELLRQGNARGDARYRRKNEIARGGMGAILQVWDENLRRNLAMKVVLDRKKREGHASIDDIDAKTLARFLEEAQVTGQLDHPGVVPVHELGIDAEGSLFFTMRLVHGRDLRTIFELVREEREGWNPTRALGVMLKVCEAMAYAHSKGVIHRDLKPANIMVGRFGEVYVMDWGLARVLDRADAHDVRLAVDVVHDSSTDLDLRLKIEVMESDLVTMDGDIVGTPSYMSPEQARGRIDEVGRRSDVYSVGAMLYHLLAGQVPYVAPGEKVSPLVVLQRMRDGPPTPLAELDCAAPAELEAICEKAMAHAPEGRYADMQELADDLRAYLEHRVVKAYEAGALAEIKKWIARNKGMAAASAAALLLLVVGLAASSALYLRSERNRRDAERNEELALANERNALAEKRRADESAVEAHRNEELARERQAEAEAAKVKVLRLSDIERLSTLEEEAADLWPAVPERGEAYEAWLERARTLTDRLALHRQELSRLREAALPSGLDAVGAALEPGASTAPDALEAPRAWRFASTEDQWQHDVLADLVQRLEAFADGERGLVADVEQRLAFAETVEEQTRTGERASALWGECIDAVADRALAPAYAGLALAPQLGLLPLGPDPDSGLWEFAHVQTGEVPERGPDGRLALAESSAVVLVLLPGGTFTMGAQADDPALPNHDPAARPDEGPVHEVTLAPFFIAKHEFTQGQWGRFRRANPSAYGPDHEDFGVKDVLHPVEQVSWDEAARVLRQLGLELPTEAQWEYAARAGTTSVWWPGDARDALIGAANIADQSAGRIGATWDSIKEWPELDDGFPVHARVGSLAANAFGLHDVHGNVLEWCRDWHGGPSSYGLEPAPGDGLRKPANARYHVYRGGGFIYSASAARSAYRDGNVPAYKGSSIGLRASRALDG